MTSEGDGAAVALTPAGKRRVLKACAACRGSKVKCDGDRPCSRCKRQNVTCVFQDVPRGSEAVKFDALQEQMRSMQEQTDSLQRTLSTFLPVFNQVKDRLQADVLGATPANSFRRDATSVSSSEATSQFHSEHFESPPVIFFPSNQSNIGGSNVFENSTVTTYSHDSLSACNPKTMISHDASSADIAPIGDLLQADLVTRGHLSLDQAMTYFASTNARESFFRGSDRFVPVFDIRFDTFAAVRLRSAFLFDSICTVGCRAEMGPTSPQSRVLNNELKKRICEVIMFPGKRSLEWIQALLVTACYSDKGWLLTSIAARLSLEMDLDGAFTELVGILMARRRDYSALGNITTGDFNIDEREILLFKKTRIWFATLVLEHIFSLDCGKVPGIQIKPDIRRCRLLISHPLRTALDLRLFAQVELNYIRATANKQLCKPLLQNDYRLHSFVQGLREELEIWFGDWEREMRDGNQNSEEQDLLMLNLQIQREHSEMTNHCHALHILGVENIASMSPEQRNILLLAKENALNFLRLMVDHREVLLPSYRYTMDFIWAKCAFSILLLLKLVQLVPETTDISKVLEDSKTLAKGLHDIHNCHNAYLKILCISIEKFEQALVGRASAVTGDQEVDHGNLSNSHDAVLDFQTYIPEEFVFDWDFPGLGLFNIPLDFLNFFMDLNPY